MSNFQLETNLFLAKNENDLDSHLSLVLCLDLMSGAVIYKRILILGRREAFIQIRSPSQDPKCRFYSSGGWKNKFFCHASDFNDN